MLGDSHPCLRYFGCKWGSKKLMHTLLPENKHLTQHCMCAPTRGLAQLCQLMALPATLFGRGDVHCSQRRTSRFRKVAGCSRSCSSRQAGASGPTWLEACGFCYLARCFPTRWELTSLCFAVRNSILNLEQKHLNSLRKY